MRLSNHADRWSAAKKTPRTCGSRPRRGYARSPPPVVGLIPQPSITDSAGSASRKHEAPRGTPRPPLTAATRSGVTPTIIPTPLKPRRSLTPTCASLDAEPPWPRPAWLIEVAPTRYPMLRQAVRTSWNREPSERTALAEQLVDHTNHVLRNQYREQLEQPGPHESTGDWMTTISAVREGATARLDGADVDAVVDRHRPLRLRDRLRAQRGCRRDGRACPLPTF